MLLKAVTRGSPGWQLSATLDMLDSEPVVAKTYRDSFAGTGLSDLLAEGCARRLFVTGAHSDYCV